MVLLCIRAEHRKWRFGYAWFGCRRPRQSGLGGMLLLGAHALHAEQLVLRAVIALFFYFHFFAPQVAHHGVLLRDCVVAEALGEAELAAVREFLDQRTHPPFGISRGFLGAAAKVHVVLHLEPAHSFVENSQFFIDGHVFCLPLRGEAEYITKRVAPCAAGGTGIRAGNPGLSRKRMWRPVANPASKVAMAKKIRVAIADDHAVLRESLALLLEA